MTKKAALQNDLSLLSILEDNLHTQIINHKSDLDLAEADLLMNFKLLKEKVVAEVEVRPSQSTFIAKKQVLDQAKTAFNNNEMAQNQKRQELLDLEKIRIQQYNSY